MIKTKKISNKCNDCNKLIARVFLAAIFAMSMFGKITGFSGSAGYAGSSWVPLPGELLILVAIIMELFGVVALVSGWKMKEGALVLVLYTFLASIMFHIGDGQMMAFLKNLGLMGGLLAISMLKPGKYSLKN